MKKVLPLILLSLFFFSCHKNKGAQITCDSYGIGLVSLPAAPGAITEPNMTLITTNTSTGQVIKNYQDVIQFISNSVAVYDHIHNLYYVYGDSYPKQSLYRFNTTTGIGDTLSVPLPDSFSIGYIFCNSTTGKLYLMGLDYYTPYYTIYEISSTATTFTQRQIANIPTYGNQYISSPVVDENTGYIYFFDSTAGQRGYTMMKVDPGSGIYTAVSTFATVPSALMYSNNDDMFYGFTIKYTSVVPLYSDPYSYSILSFVSVDPATGNVNKIADTLFGVIQGVYSLVTPEFNTFDYCNNSYVTGDGCLDLSTGKIVKQFSPSAFYNYPALY